ncbi:type II toxin-antitoxin system RelE/ParE family toxin [Duganella sp. FT109W]|uniref:Type II toxin-antitoxin system RelE/ParE family toxin n=1 Tax=Duganella margarita TaxID=2692170 RepID=A0ABW9WB51_9BURK|nr:type II toxin-antitoxin system RelE/ParE family toxin [Duganella margarita]MYN38302.1 type II toxin-antitoxin system RelE/ParE family toxin [Duganella margarita]
MSKPSAKPAKLAVRWSAKAQHSLEQTLAHINAQDESAGRLVLQRLQVALDLIAIQPHIGTPTNRRRSRRFPVPKTGHTIDYRVEQSEILVLRWMRQRRKS